MSQEEEFKAYEETLPPMEFDGPPDAEVEEWMNAALGSVPESPTPALDKVLERQYADEATGASVPELEPDLFFAAALEAYNLMGQALSEAGSMYLLVGSMLGAITPSETTEVTE